MVKEDAIVAPLMGKNTPKLGPFAVMVGIQGDLRMVCGSLNLKEDHARRLATSKVYCGSGDAAGYSVAGPAIGAPYAAIVLETLIAWGAERIIFFGWCGSVSPQVKIGDIIIPTAAIIDEGTSRHYNGQWRPSKAGDRTAGLPFDVVPGSTSISQRLQCVLAHHGYCFHEGRVWSTDAIFRETREKVLHFQARGALAVEMEMSALFTIGRFRNIEVGGLLVVSDELATFQWRPGFKEQRFIQGRRKACEVIGSLCQSLSTPASS